MQTEFNRLSFAVIDLETTGFSDRVNEIIEIGLVKIENLSIIDTFQSLVKPKAYIPLNITKLTGLNGDFLVNAPELLEIKEKIEALIRNRILVEHSKRNFDIAFLKSGLQIKNKLLHMNTLTLFSRMSPRSKKKDLSTMCKALNVQLPNHHYALDDAKGTSECLIKMLKLYMDNGTLRFSDLPRSKDLIKWV